MGEFAVGQPVPRFEDPRLLRGGGRYVDDLKLAGLAHGVVLRSQHAHAKILKLDVSAAKAAPGKFNFASNGVGNITHIGGELFNMMAGTKMLHVPYKGGGPVMIDLLAGRISVFFSTVSTAAAHIKAGKLRAIGATTAEPSAAFPDVPTVARTGLPGYEVSGWYGILAPTGTPKSVIDKLNRATRAALSKPELKAKLLAVGVEAVDTTPAQFRQFLVADIKKWGKVVRTLNITAQ